MISIIAVIGKNRELGKNNSLLWHVPGDLPRFKTITSGHPVIMGKNTFLSIGKPLPNRSNIIVSSTLPNQDGVFVARAFEEALKIAEQQVGKEEIFIIGGGNIYSQAIEKTDRLYLTLVDKTADADTYFPEYKHFTKVISQEQRNEQGLKFSYLILERQ